MSSAPTAVPSATARLSSEAARRISRLTNATVALIAVAAAALSYDGLHRLAIGAGVPGPLSYLLPVVIDGLVVAGSLSTVYAALAGLSARWPWTLVGVGVAASVVGNVLAARPTITGHVVAATPPIVLALSLETALRLQRHRAGLPTPARRPRKRTATHATLAPATEANPATPASIPTPAKRPTNTARHSTSGGPTIRATVHAALDADPHTTMQALYEMLPGRDKSTVRRHVREWRAARDTQVDDGLPSLRLAAVGSD